VYSALLLAIELLPPSPLAWYLPLLPIVSTLSSLPVVLHDLKLFLLEGLKHLTTVATGVHVEFTLFPIGCQGVKCLQPSSNAILDGYLVVRYY
jgi:hypothetical protein